ncbi:MAG: tetratricopeptide repeat protein [Chitinivibrionales bacterium]|nr:tetratricopeptide repeat protein [Chitinivibrionales bacterium]MBD3395587.1 tetratricopeptide repeat protein [Chitinivibrionales bacterium]
MMMSDYGHQFNRLSPGLDTLAKSLVVSWRNTMRSLLSVVMTFAVIITATARADDEAAKISADQTDVPLILVALPVDASGNPEDRQEWFAPLSEQLFHFRMSASDQLRVIPARRMHAAVRESGVKTLRSVRDYLPVAREMGATHILLQNYEVSRDRKTASSLLELGIVSSGEVAAAFEQDIAIEKMVADIDEAVMWSFNSLGITPDENLTRFFNIPAVPIPHRGLEDLGAVAGLVVGAPEKRMDAIAQQAMDIVDKDSRNLLAQYVAAAAYDRAGDHFNAAMTLKDILAVIPNHTALYIDVCRNFRLSDRYKEVLKYASAAESKAIKSSALLLEGGLAFESLGRLQKARRVFEAVIDMDENQPDALLFFTREHNRKGEYEKAGDLAKRIIAQEPGNGHAHFELGKALAMTGKTQDAIATLEKSAALIPDEAAVRRLLADLYSEGGMHEKAAGHYEHILRLNPKFYAGHIKAAEAWEKAGNVKQAAEILVRAERLFPEKVDLQRRIGLLQHSLGNTSNAVLHLERFVKKGEPDASVYMVLGAIYTETERYDRALYMYNHAMPLMKDKNPCRFALGKFHMKKGDYQAAISQLLDILKEDTGYAGVHRMLADAWYAVGTTTEALTCYKKARELEGDDAFVQKRIAGITFEAGNYPVAAVEYRKLTKLDATDAQAYYRLAIVSLEQNSEREAEVFLATARKLGSPEMNTSFMLGKGYDKVGNARKAIAAYSACLEKKSDHQKALTRMSAAHLKLGQKVAAAECYVKLFELNNAQNKDYLARAGLLHEEANSIKRAHELYKLFVNKGYKNHEINLHLARFEYGHHLYQKVIDLLAGLDGSHLGDVQTVRMLGESYYQSSQHAKALPWLETAAANTPADPKVVEMLAVSYEKQGQLENARHSYGNLLGLIENDRKPDLAFHIGELFEKDRKFEDAIGRYHLNAEAYPNDMRNYDCLVRLYRNDQRLAEAREVLEKAVVRPQAEARFLKTLAEVCAGQNDKVAAVKRYREYVELKPDDSSAWRSMGEIYFSKQLYAKAATSLAKAAALEPKHFEVQFMLARALRQVGKIAEAAAAAEGAHAVQPNDSDVLVLLCDCYRAINDIEKLVATLRKLTTVRPGDFASTEELGNLLLASGKTTDGVAALEKASSMRPNNAALHVTLARAYESLGNADARYAHLKSALDADGQNLDAHFELGRYYVASDREKKAERHFASALELDGNHAPSLYAYSLLLAGSDRGPEALEHMRRAVGQDPYVAEYQVLFARLAWEAGHADAAVKAVEAALDIDAGSVPALALAGRLYREAGKSDEAKAVLTKAIAKDPNCAGCYRTLARICFDECDYAPAIGYFKRAIEIDGYDEKTAVGLACAYKLGCQDTRAAELFGQVLDKNPDQHEAFYHLTNLHIRSGRFDEAREMVKRRKRDQKTVWHHLAAGEIFEIEGDADAARISYTVALRLKPDIPEAHSGLGRVDLAKGDHNNAIVNFGKALARDPYNPYLMLDLARAYEGIGEYASAFEIYREVSSKYPQVAEAYYRFAQLKSHQKQHMRAMEIVKQGLEHNPKNPRLLMGLGHAYRMVNRYQEAVDAYVEAVKRGGEQCLDAYIYIATIYGKHLGNEEEARRYTKKYVRAGGEEETLKKQMAILE